MKMELGLKYDPQVRHSIAAAFVKGATARDWLQEIDSWGITPDGLTCLIIPQGMDTVQPAGLFAIFKEAETPDAARLRYPYGVVAGKLFVPADATLTPAIGTQELSGLLLWDWQVFHPVIGFIGFEKTDRISLTALLDHAKPKESAWSRPHSGLPPAPRLQYISVERPETENIMDALKADIGSRPLQDIRAKDGERWSIAWKILERSALALLSLLLPLILLLHRLLPAPGPAISANRGPGRPGWLQRLEGWISANIEELERKRNKEIQRLLKMFDENTNEALQYAIPLNSPYLNRGTAPPSSRLSRRDTYFNFSGLGGGGAVDAWNIGSFYGDLRTKYQQAANQELAAANFKKAAYIFAHLMGDFHAAANALEQGQHFREAAALYKDHLKSASTAAACLEKGGLLLEAIPLYETLGMYEKAGDLYQRLEQPEQAAARYGQCIELCLKNNDHLQAARIMDEKLQQPDNARQTLLTGWNDHHQAEACLTQYFAIVAAGEPGALPQHITDVYTHRTPPSKRLHFLNVLATVRGKHETAETKAVTTHLAYQLISEQASIGNRSSLHMLKQFVPADPLLQADCNRYINTRKVRFKAAPTVTSFQLAKDIQWGPAARHGNQVLLLGTAKAGVYLVRLNDEGTYEYHLWSMPVDHPYNFSIATDTVYSKRIFVHTGNAHALSEKVLPDNKAFVGDLTVGSPDWLPATLMGFTVNKEGGLTIVHTNKSTALLSFYTEQGKLLKTVDCRFVPGTEGLHLQEDDGVYCEAPPGAVQEMIYRLDQYFCYYENCLLSIAENGQVKLTALDSRIRMLTATGPHSALRIIAATEKGCVLLRYSAQKLQVVGQPFAVDFHPTAIRYVADNLLVVAAVRHATVFSIKDDQPEILCTLETDTPIARILPIAKRNHCALLEKNGKVTIHHIDLNSP